MKPEPRERDDAPEAFAPEAVPCASTVEPLQRGYRVSGDIEVRAKELEHALVELRARHKELERELWRTRKLARTNKALAIATVTSAKAGLGAAIASPIAMGLYFLSVVTSPPILLGVVIAGALLGVFLDVSNADDDGFPPPPPPRLHY
ncbi:MAG TPA: hypothetical protein VM580_02340 [Labilithrix sp.]|nr:hypothetical protein [Labilithrix sp.]